MSTSTIGQYFSNRVEELISEFTGHTLIFFKGFAEKALALPEVKGLLMEAVNEHNRAEQEKRC